MKYVKHYFCVYDFKHFDLTTAQGVTEFEQNFLPRVKYGLIAKAMEENTFNQDDKNYIFSFERDYWNDDKIQEEVDTHLYVLSGMYKAPNCELYYTARKEAVELLKSWKPFDLVLVIKSEEELQNEWEYDKMIERNYGITVKGLSRKEKNEMVRKMQEFHLKGYE